MVRDEWTRECEKVWPALYKAVARGFHPDKTGGDAELEAFFKVAGDKNDAFNGKGPSAETTAREERGARAARGEAAEDGGEAREGLPRGRDPAAGSLFRASLTLLASNCSSRRRH